MANGRILLTILFALIATVSKGSIFFENHQKASLHNDKGWYRESQTRRRLDLCGEWIYRMGGKGPWQKVTVPSCYDHKGKVVFKKNFTPDSSFAGRHFKLVAYGINYKCLIKINGKFVGSHEGGYSSFAIDLEEGLIQIGRSNQITIEGDNRLNSRNTIPLRQLVGGWRNYGGIFREIFLIALPQIAFEKPWVKLDFERGYKGCRVTVHGNLRRFGDKFPVKDIRCYAEIREKATGKVVAYTLEKTFQFKRPDLYEVDLSLRVKSPQLWSPQNPVLYELHVFLFWKKKMIDHNWLDFGFREIRLIDGDLYLNGERIILKGINRYEDYPGLGSSLNYQVMERDIIDLKKLGANSLRLTHYPHHPYLLDLCDQYGLLVLEEIPVWNIPAPQLTEDDFIQLAKSYLKEMIDRDRNHPSVIAWGIGSGFDSARPRSRDYVEEIYRFSKALDDRPVYYTTRMLRGDHCGDLVDIIGLDIPFQKLDHIPEYLAHWKRRFPQKPLIVSSYGFPLQFMGSQQNQAYMLTNAFLKIRDIDGGFITALADWRGDRPILHIEPGSDPYLMPLGLLEFDREERIAFKAVKKLYTEGEALQITRTDLSEENPPEYPLIGLALVMVFLYLYRRDHRLRGNLKRVFVHPYGFYLDLRERRKIPLAYSLFISLSVCVGMALLLSAFSFALKGDLLFDYVLTHLLINDSLKEKVIRLIWHPLSFVATFSLIFFFLFLLQTLVIKLLAYILGKRLSLGGIFTFVCWVSASLLFLIPLGVVFYKVIQLPGLRWIPYTLIGLLFLWYGVRLFRGVKILYNLNYLKTAILFLSLMTLIGVTIGSYYEKTQSTWEYLSYFRDIWQNGG